MKCHLTSSLLPRQTKLALSVFGLLGFATAHLTIAAVKMDLQGSQVVAIDVSPAGWRRTVHGWELAEHWGRSQKWASRDINQWIAVQEKQEASLTQSVLNQIRATHPLVFTTSLLVVVVAIAMFHERYQRQRSFNSKSASGAVT